MTVRFGIMATAAIGVLALAGCGSKEEDAGQGGPKSAAQVREEAGKLERPEPGEYRQQVEITSLEVPGMPASAAEQMKSAMKATQDGTFCLTKADAERGYEDMFNGIGKGNHCSHSKFDVDGGQLDAQMECQSQQQGKAVMKVKGTVAKDGSNVTVVMDTTGGPPPITTMKMTMQLTTTRLGDCKGT